MPHSIFLKGGYAIHGTCATASSVEIERCCVTGMDGSKTDLGGSSSVDLAQHSSATPFRFEASLHLLHLIGTGQPSRNMMMRKTLIVLASVLGMFWSCASAEARVNINVDLATQTMQVSSATGSYVWPISSARSGYSTPTGSYGIQRMEAMHLSHKYHNSPMPHSLFFKGGYAIHGSYAVGSLGSPASHGCVRLSPGHATQLYEMVRAEGASITITGSSPSRGDAQVARRRSAEPETVADDEDDRPVVTRHGRHRDRDYARQDRSGKTALGYAPVRPAPSHGDWMENPFGAILSGY